MDREFYEQSEVAKKYKNYINKKRIHKRVRTISGLAALALGIFGFYGLSTNAQDIKGYSAQIENLTYSIQEIDAELDNLEISDNHRLVLEMQLESEKQQIEYYKKLKGLSIGSEVAYGAIALLPIFLREYLLSKIKKEKDNKKLDFYKKFLDEVVYIYDESYSNNLDSILNYFIADVAKEQNVSYEEVCKEINKDEVFPEYENKYFNIFKFISQYLKTHDYEKTNKIVYDVLPKIRIDFVLFLHERNLNESSFMKLTYKQQVDIIEEFMEEQIKELNEKENNLQALEQQKI